MKTLMGKSKRLFCAVGLLVWGTLGCCARFRSTSAIADTPQLSRWATIDEDAGDTLRIATNRILRHGGTFDVWTSLAFRADRDVPATRARSAYSFASSIDHEEIDCPAGASRLVSWAEYSRTGQLMNLSTGPAPRRMTTPPPGSVAESRIHAVCRYIREHPDVIG